MSLSKIGAIIEALRYESYRWTPVRRIYIEKPNSTKLRPLGLPSCRINCSRMMRSLLEAYYEPQFSPYHMGSVQGGDVTTALSEMYYKWIGTKWL